MVCVVKRVRSIFAGGADGAFLIKTFAPRFSVQTLHSALGSSLASLPVFDLVAFVAFGILRRGSPLTLSTWNGV